MKLQIVIVFFAFISGLLMAKQPLNCQVGQLKIALAGGQWQVNSCDDGRSLVFVTMKDNPAMPFVFFVLRDGTTSKIRGEGNGAKEHTSVAYTALKAMTEKQFDQLVQATLEQ